MNKPSLIDYLSKNPYSQIPLDLSLFDLKAVDSSGKNGLLYAFSNNVSDEIYLKSEQFCYLIDNSDLKIKDNFGQSVLNYFINYKIEEVIDIPEKYVLKIFKHTSKELLRNALFEILPFEKVNNILSPVVWDYIIKKIRLQDKVTDIDNMNLLVYLLFYPESSNNLSHDNWRKIINKTINIENSIGLERTLYALCSLMSSKEMRASFTKICSYLDNKLFFINCIETNASYKMLSAVPEFIALKEKIALNNLLLEGPIDNTEKFKI